MARLAHKYDVPEVLAAIEAWLTRPEAAQDPEQVRAACAGFMSCLAFRHSAQAALVCCLQVLAGLQLATDLQLDGLRAHALLGAARQLISSGATRAGAGILEAAQIPGGNAWLLLAALAAAVTQAPEAARQQVLARLPTAPELVSWMRLSKQAGGAFEWEIEGFSGQEGRLVSPEFSVGGYQWALECYPKGDPSMKAEGHLSLYLRLMPSLQVPGGWEQARCSEQLSKMKAGPSCGCAA